MAKPYPDFTPPPRTYDDRLAEQVSRAVAEAVQSYREAVDILHPIAVERGCGIRVRWFCVYTGKIQMEAYVDHTVPMGHIVEDRQM